MPEMDEQDVDEKAEPGFGGWLSRSWLTACASALVGGIVTALVIHGPNQFRHWLDTFSRTPGFGGVAALGAAAVAFAAASKTVRASRESTTKTIWAQAVEKREDRWWDTARWAYDSFARQEATRNVPVVLAVLQHLTTELGERPDTEGGRLVKSFAAAVEEQVNRQRQDLVAQTMRVLQSVARPEVHGRPPVIARDGTRVGWAPWMVAEEEGAHAGAAWTALPVRATDETRVRLAPLLLQIEGAVDYLPTSATPSEVETSPVITVPAGGEPSADQLVTVRAHYATTASDRDEGWGDDGGEGDRAEEPADG